MEKEERKREGETEKQTPVDTHGAEWKKERERLREGTVRSLCFSGDPAGYQLSSAQFFHPFFAHRGRLRSTDNLN